MMCEHEFVQEEWIVEVCNKCDKLRGVIAVEDQLVAANARVAELEKDNARQKRIATISRLCKNVQACRAEKVEAQVALLSDELVEMFTKLEQAEASCAAYKKALDIAMSTNQSHETYCKVEAALEGKA